MTGGRWTLPALMHEVHTARRTVRPSTKAFTRWMFGLHRFDDRRCEWDTCLPNHGFLPHNSHVDAMIVPLVQSGSALEGGSGPGSWRPKVR